jgi:sn-glycerol 3-phosphate transport system permease protein
MAPEACRKRSFRSGSKARTASRLQPCETILLADQALPAGAFRRQAQRQEADPPGGHVLVERRPLLTFTAHLVLLLGVAMVALPIWLTFVASTHPGNAILRAPVPVWPGGQMIENYLTVLGQGVKRSSSGPVALMMWNSAIMATGIAVGKILISILSAFAIVYFRFPFRMLAFWTIFVTLMLPVEVRILPTYEVVANLGMLNSYGGLIVPLIASATATFLFRQFFLTVPDELTEAARIDGAGPMKFFWDILLPLSRTNIAALFVILVIYGWNQYLWPLLITADEDMTTIVMGIQRMTTAADSEPQWHLIMAVAILALVPPVLVVVVMQRWFVRGLIDAEK